MSNYDRLDSTGLSTLLNRLASVIRQGHKVKDSSGTAMTQRTNMRFVGATVTDDSTNDTTTVSFSGSGGSTVSVSHTGTASSSGVRKQQISVDNVAYDVDGTAYMEQTINTSTSATSSATFSNAAITANSVIDVYTSQFGLNHTNISVSAGSCVVTFPAQSSAASVTVRIYIR